MQGPISRALCPRLCLTWQEIRFSFFVSNAGTGQGGPVQGLTHWQHMQYRAAATSRTCRGVSLVLA